MAITRIQCRAARALLEWTQRDLAEQAKVGFVTVRRFEADPNDRRSDAKHQPFPLPGEDILQRLRDAFIKAGIVFSVDGDLDGASVTVAVGLVRRRKTSQAK